MIEILKILYDIILSKNYTSNLFALEAVRQCNVMVPSFQKGYVVHTI